MKNCNEIRENISSYIDEELTVNERLVFEEHIASCAECKSQFDEMLQIVGFCRDTEDVELPVNFKEELHRKLIEAAGEKGTETAAVKRARYIRLITSIAAGFILIFLFGTFYRFGLSPHLKASGSNTGNAADMSQAAATQALGETFGAAIPVPSESTVLQYKDEAKDSGAPAVAAVPEAGRSTSDSSRFIQVPAMLTKTAEVANSSVSNLTLLVDDPAAQSENIKQLAVKNSGEEQKPAGSFSLDVTVTASVAATVDTSVQNDMVLVFSIPNKQYDSFINELNSNYGQTNVKAGAKVTEDKTSDLENLIKKSEDLDSEIKKLEDTDSKANADKINELNMQLQSIQGQIESLRLNTDFTVVTVTLKKK